MRILYFTGAIRVLPEREYKNIEEDYTYHIIDEATNSKFDEYKGDEDGLIDYMFNEYGSFEIM